MQARDNGNIRVLDLGKQEIDGMTQRTALVTGGTGGIGSAIVRHLAKQGHKVATNYRDEAKTAAWREAMAQEGIEVCTVRGDVSDPESCAAMVRAIEEKCGPVDILVNNAGILRDRTFAKLDLADFRLVLDVHVMGSVNCTKAVWSHMKERGYGRVIFTTSSSGLYGNFGQSAYSAAKMALVGLMQTLALEGERYGIRVNCLAPSAATQMTHDLWSPEDLAALDPGLVSPGVVALASEAAPNKRVLLAGAGSFKLAHVTMTRGIHLSGERLSAEEILGRWQRIEDRSGEMVPAAGLEQYRYEAEQARADTASKAR